MHVSIKPLPTFAWLGFVLALCGFASQAHSQPNGQLSRIYWVESCDGMRSDLIKRRAKGEVDLDQNGNFEWYELMAYQHCGRVRNLLVAAKNAGIADKIEFWEGTEALSQSTLRQLPVGKQIDLPLLRIVFPENVFFDTDSFEVRDEVWPVLSVIAESMISEPDHIALFIAGHSDYRGPREYNEALSRRRARAGLAAIKVLGVSRGETYTVSFGEDLPLNPSFALSEIAVNRRLEFLVGPVAEVPIQYIRRQQPLLPCIGKEDRESGNCPDIDRPVQANIPIERIDPAVPMEAGLTVSQEEANESVSLDGSERVVVKDRFGERVVVTLPIEERIVIVYGQSG